MHFKKISSKVFQKMTQKHRWSQLSHQSVQFSRSVVSDSLRPRIAVCQVSLSITNSRSSLRLRSIESVKPSSHLILCRPLLLPPPIPRSIRVFSNESTLRMRWSKYWSFSFSLIPSKEIPGLSSELFVKQTSQASCISNNRRWDKCILMQSYHTILHTSKDTWTTATG